MTAKLLNCSFVLLLPLTLLALAGCPGETARPPLTGTGMDMFGPVALRVHPLTRTAAPGNLEVRLEFSDQFQDTGKAVGLVTLEVFEYQMLLPNNRGSRLGQFTFDLTTPAENKKYWDGITRTYLFKIPTDPAIAKAIAAKESLVVSAVIALPGGGQLSDQFTLAPK